MRFGELTTTRKIFLFFEIFFVVIVTLTIFNYSILQSTNFGNHDTYLSQQHDVTIAKLNDASNIDEIYDACLAIREIEHIAFLENVRLEQIPTKLRLNTFDLVMSESTGVIWDNSSAFWGARTGKVLDILKYLEYSDYQNVYAEVSNNYKRIYNDRGIMINDDFELLQDIIIVEPAFLQDIGIPGIDEQFISVLNGSATLTEPLSEPLELDSSIYYGSSFNYTVGLEDSPNSFFNLPSLNNYQTTYNDSIITIKNSDIRYWKTPYYTVILNQSISLPNLLADESYSSLAAGLLGYNSSWDMNIEENETNCFIHEALYELQLLNEEGELIANNFFNTKFINASNQCLLDLSLDVVVDNSESQNNNFNVKFFQHNLPIKTIVDGWNYTLLEEDGIDCDQFDDPLFEISSLEELENKSLPYRLNITDYSLEIEEINLTESLNFVIQLPDYVLIDINSEIDGNNVIELPLIDTRYIYELPIREYSSSWLDLDYHFVIDGKAITGCILNDRQLITFGDLESNDILSEEEYPTITNYEFLDYTQIAVYEELVYNLLNNVETSNYNSLFRELKTLENILTKDYVAEFIPKQDIMDKLWGDFDPENKLVKGNIEDTYYALKTMELVDIDPKNLITDNEKTELLNYLFDNYNQGSYLFYDNQQYIKEETSQCAFIINQMWDKGYSDEYDFLHFSGRGSNLVNIEESEDLSTIDQLKDLKLKSLLTELETDSIRIYQPDFGKPTYGGLRITSFNTIIKSDITLPKISLMTLISIAFVLFGALDVLTFSKFWGSHIIVLGGVDLVGVTISASQFVNETDKQIAVIADRAESFLVKWETDAYYSASNLRFGSYNPETEYDQYKNSVYFQNKANSPNIIGLKAIPSTTSSLTTLNGINDQIPYSYDYWIIGQSQNSERLKRITSDISKIELSTTPVVNRNDNVQQENIPQIRPSIKDVNTKITTDSLFSKYADDLKKGFVENIALLWSKIQLKQREILQHALNEIKNEEQKVFAENMKKFDEVAKLVFVIVESESSRVLKKFDGKDDANSQIMAIKELKTKINERINSIYGKDPTGKVSKIKKITDMIFDFAEKTGMLKEYVEETKKKYELDNSIRDIWDSLIGDKTVFSRFLESIALEYEIEKMQEYFGDNIHVNIKYLNEYYSTDSLKKSSKLRYWHNDNLIGCILTVTNDNFGKTEACSITSFIPNIKDSKDVEDIVIKHFMDKGVLRDNGRLEFTIPSIYSTILKEIDEKLFVGFVNNNLEKLKKLKDMMKEEITYFKQRYFFVNDLSILKWFKECQKEIFDFYSKDEDFVVIMNEVLTNYVDRRKSLLEISNADNTVLFFERSTNAVLKNNYLMLELNTFKNLVKEEKFQNAYNNIKMMNSFGLDTIKGQVDKLENEILEIPKAILSSNILNNYRIASSEKTVFNTLLPYLLAMEGTITFKTDKETIMSKYIEKLDSNQYHANTVEEFLLNKKIIGKDGKILDVQSMTFGASLGYCGLISGLMENFIRSFMKNLNENSQEELSAIKKVIKNLFGGYRNKKGDFLNSYQLNQKFARDTEINEIKDKEISIYGDSAQDRIKVQEELEILKLNKDIRDLFFTDLKFNENIDVSKEEFQSLDDKTKIDLLRYSYIYKMISSRSNSVFVYTDTFFNIQSNLNDFEIEKQKAFFNDFGNAGEIAWNLVESNVPISKDTMIYIPKETPYSTLRNLIYPLLDGVIKELLLNSQLGSFKTLDEKYNFLFPEIKDPNIQ